jgi:hypothetical protein
VTRVNYIFHSPWGALDGTGASRRAVEPVVGAAVAVLSCENPLTVLPLGSIPAGKSLSWTRNSRYRGGVTITQYASTSKSPVLGLEELNQPKWFGILLCAYQNTLPVRQRERAGRSARSKRTK